MENNYVPRPVIVGFTGSRRTDAIHTQRSTFERLIAAICGTVRFAEFRHGGCYGWDAIAAVHVDALKKRPRIICHPSNFVETTDMQAVKASDVVLPVRHPLTRNRDIVKASTFMVACPATNDETQRSGTWSTVRCAVKMYRPVFVVRPDGFIELYNPSDAMQLILETANKTGVTVEQQITVPEVPNAG